MIRLVRTVGSRTLVLVTSLVLVLALAATGRGDVEFLRGDVNQDGQVSISDAGAYDCILFCAGPPPPCEDAVDVDDNSVIDIVDMVVLLVHLYGDDPSMSIQPPFPSPGSDPTEDSLSCDSYTATPPPETDDVMRLGSVRAAPGEEVRIPLFVTAPVEVEGLQAVIHYDPALFTPLPVTSEDEELVFQGTYFDGLRSRPRSFSSLKDFGHEGIFRLGVLFDLLGVLVVKPESEVHVVNIAGTVSPHAERGAKVELSFVAHHSEEGILRNELTMYGTTRTVTQTISGFIDVAEAFVRGDANVDGNVDISDGIHILNGLFTGGAVIDCSDSADYNDDDLVDVSDAISLLSHLFLGGPAPSPPYPDCGVDPSVDALDCVSYPPCP